MSRFYQYCHEPGCSERQQSYYCATHAKQTRTRYDHDRKQDPIWTLYNSAKWRVHFRAAFFAAGNVICQRILAGKQCTRRAEVLHHLVSPKIKPELFFNFQNIVGVCRGHHPTETGEPEENMSRIHEIYVPTKIPCWMERGF